MDPDLKDLIKKLTNKDYNKRISVKQMKKHPFFQGVDF
jgi:Protein kinase domain.